MPRILLIEDDETVRKAMGRLLTFHRYEYADTSTGREGIRLAQETAPDVAIVDYRLPDMSGLDVLAELATKCPRTARILLTGYATFDLAIQAMRLGSCDCLTKPASQQHILDAVERALARQPRLSEPPAQQGEFTNPVANAAAVRVAEPIVKVIDELTDPYTLAKFGKASGVSVGGFRNWCRTARLKSRAAHHFARALRAVYQFERDRSTRPEGLLTIVDCRTIAKFVKKSGGQGDRLPDTVSDFLDRQQFIAEREVIEAVRRELAGRRRA